MKKRNRLFVSVLVFALSGLLYAADLTLKEASVHWEGSMPAKAHDGVIPVQHVHAAMDGEKNLTELHVVLDMQNLTVTDLKKEKDRLKLEGHLKSEDFFYVSEHPTAVFTLKEHTPGLLVGSLTIRGISKDAEIPVVLEKNEAGDWVLKADFSFNRQEFNVNYQNSGLFGVAKDKLIRDTVDVKVHLVLGPGA